MQNENIFFHYCGNVAGVKLEENKKLHRNYRVIHSCCSLDVILTSTHSAKGDGMEWKVDQRERHSQVSVEILAGRRTWWHFTVEKLRSTCQPGEIEDILLLSQQCSRILSFFLSPKSCTKTAEIDPEYFWLGQIEVNFNILARTHKPLVEKCGLFVKEIYISLIFLCFFFTSPEIKCITIF